MQGSLGLRDLGGSGFFWGFGVFWEPLDPLSCFFLGGGVGGGGWGVRVQGFRV